MIHTHCFVSFVSLFFFCSASSSSRELFNALEVLKNYSIDQLMSLKRAITDDRASLVKQIENLQHTIDHLLDQQQMLLTGTQTLGPDGTRMPILAATNGGVTAAPSQSTFKSLSADRELASLQRQAADWQQEKTVLLDQREELLAQLKKFAEAHEAMQAKLSKKRAKEAADKEARTKERQEAAEQIAQLQAQIARKEERIKSLNAQIESMTTRRGLNPLSATGTGELRLESLDDDKYAGTRNLAATGALPENDYDALLKHYRATRDALLSAQVALRLQQTTTTTTITNPQ